VWWQILSETPQLLTMHLAALLIRVETGCKELNEDLWKCLCLLLYPIYVKQDLSSCRSQLWNVRWQSLSRKRYPGFKEPCSAKKACSPHKWNVCQLSIYILCGPWNVQQWWCLVENTDTICYLFVWQNSILRTQQM